MPPSLKSTNLPWPLEFSQGWFPGAISSAQEVRELSARTDRWLRLAALRSEVVEETKSLDRDIDELEEAVRVIDVALQARELWNDGQLDVIQKLGKLGQPKEIRKKYVELLKKYTDRIAISTARVNEIKMARRKLIDEAKGIKINHVVWSQATRIEALTEHAGWVQTLETQIERLKKELAGYETNLQSQTVTAGSPGFDISLANQQTIQALRRPMKLISDEEERLESAKRNVEDAKAEIRVQLRNRATPGGAERDRSANRSAECWRADWPVPPPHSDRTATRSTRPASR